MERERVERNKGFSDDEAIETEGEIEDGEEINTDMGAKERERVMRKNRRAQELKKDSFQTEVLRTTNMLLSRKAMGALALEDAKLAKEIGAAGICLACRTKSCQWEACIDEEPCKQRMRELELELERVKFDKETKVFTSLVTLSAQLGGNTKFRRKDLLTELASECADLEKRMRLNAIDKELHDAYASRKEYIEIKHLHGYSTMIWTTNARKALEAECSRLIASTTARDTVEDILDWMLEGWYFGERASSFQVVGYVPSIKRNGSILPGKDQILAIGATKKSISYRTDMRRRGVLLPIAQRGTLREKASGVEADAVLRLSNEKVAKEGSLHAKILNETESTLRFGLFMLTLMYFRAMSYLRREKKSWSGQGDDIVDAKASKVVAITKERIRMLEENSRVANRKKRLDSVMERCLVGEHRRSEREKAERRDNLLRLQVVVRRQRLEAESVNCIQKVYRGHLTRKAVRRWALKKAELAAMFAVLDATAIFLQRVWRGYIGRLITKQKRIEMAHFIALMRKEEAEDDEFIYWENHSWQKFKRNTKAWARKTVGLKDKTSAIGDGASILTEHLQRNL